MVAFCCVIEVVFVVCFVDAGEVYAVFGEEGS